MEILKTICLLAGCLAFILWVCVHSGDQAERWDNWPLRIAAIYWTVAGALQAIINMLHNVH
jgi:hypothetical protein